MRTIETEVKKGQRFEFGKNWNGFLSTLTRERIEIAEQSLKDMLGMNNLNGQRVLDIGSGSGLFSLAARKLGAKVYSFDYDPASVSCTKELRSRYFLNDQNWFIEEGSVLDGDFLNQLGTFDIVYSWGVLHHTGNMWAAFDNVTSLVKKHGILFIAIYNDQGSKSRFWKKVKEFYCSGFLGKFMISTIFIPYFFLRTLLLCVLKRKNEFTEYKKNRGMSIIHDWIDWLGGFPFEVATVEEVFGFFRDRGFLLINISTTNGAPGCNQFIFVRNSEEPT